MSQPFFSECGALFGGGDVEDQRASDLRARSICIQQAIEEIRYRILFFLSTVVTVGKKRIAQLFHRRQICSVHPGKMSELATGAHFFHFQTVSKDHTISEELVIDGLIVFLPRLAVVRGFAGLDLDEASPWNHSN